MNQAEQDPQMREERADAIRSMLTSAVRDEPVRRAKATRRRFAIIGGAAVLAVGGAATAGALIAGSASVSNDSIVHCLSKPVINGDGTYPGSSATIATPSGQGRVSDAIGLCSEMWRQGALTEGFDPTASDNPPGTVPADIQVCVMRDGSAAVVPSPEPGICQGLGLASLEG